MLSCTLSKTDGMLSSFPDCSSQLQRNHCYHSDAWMTATWLQASAPVIKVQQVPFWCGIIYLSSVSNAVPGDCWSQSRSILFGNKAVVDKAIACFWISCLCSIVQEQLLPCRQHDWLPILLDCSSNIGCAIGHLNPQPTASSAGISTEAVLATIVMACKRHAALRHYSYPSTVAACWEWLHRSIIGNILLEAWPMYALDCTCSIRTVSCRLEHYDKQ